MVGLIIAVWTMPEGEEAGIAIETASVASNSATDASGGGTRPSGPPVGQHSHDASDNAAIVNTLEKPESSGFTRTDEWLERFDRFRTVHRHIAATDPATKDSEPSDAIAPQVDGTIDQWALVAKENRLFVRPNVEPPTIAVSKEAKPEAVYGSRRQMAWMRGGMVRRQTAVSTADR